MQTRIDEGRAAALPLAKLIHYFLLDKGKEILNHDKKILYT
jgi:hypothetical protein